MAKQRAEAQSKTHPVRSKAPQSRAADLDRLIHEPIRLGIVSALAVNETMTFNELKELLKTTDGNLSVHARKLEEGQYLACEKYFEGRLPKTEYRLTAAGRRRQVALSRASTLAARLDALSPLAVLGRGYAVCWNAARTSIIRSASAVASGDTVHVRLAEGEITCDVRQEHDARRLKPEA